MDHSAEDGFKEKIPCWDEKLEIFPAKSPASKKIEERSAKNLKKMGVEKTLCY